MSTQQVLKVVEKLLPRLADKKVSEPTFGFGGDNIGAIQVFYRETEDGDSPTLTLHKMTQNKYDLAIDTVLSMSVVSRNRLPTLQEFEDALALFHHRPEYVTFYYGGYEEHYNLNGKLLKKEFHS